MADQGKHAFLSYVSEDSGRVDELCKVLDAAGIPYWRDRKDLWPGDQWKTMIRTAIQSGSLVFLACFSEQSRARAKSYQNEELNLAVGEMRQMPPGRPWLVPIRLDDGPVPDWELRPGMTLSDLNRVDFFGPSIAAESARLATTISRLMGEAAPDPTTLSVAVAEATSDQRVDMLRRATKETVLDPTKRIQLDDLIAAELIRVLHGMRDEASFPVNVDSQRLLDHWTQAAKSAQQYASLLAPLTASLQVAARWADPTRLTPWVTAIRTLAAEAETVRGGSKALLSVRRLPVVLLVMAAAVAALGDKRWDNLRAVAMDVTVPFGQSGTLRPVIDVFYPWRAFDSNEDLANVVARVGVGGLLPEQAATAGLEKSVGQYKAPISDWLYLTLRPLFADQFPDDALYTQAFDRAEAVLGVLSQDQAEEDKKSHPDQPHWAHPGSNWFGRATYTSVWSSSPVDDLAAEATAAGTSWEPLRARLFGGDPIRATGSIGAYRVDFEDLRRRRT